MDSGDFAIERSAGVRGFSCAFWMMERFPLDSMTAYSTLESEGVPPMRRASRRSLMVSRSRFISFLLILPFSISMLGDPLNRFFSRSLLMERREMSTCRNNSVKMAVTPLIMEMSGDSIGMAASSAIMKETII